MNYGSTRSTANCPRSNKSWPRLSAPLIITARHPAEGGLNNLSASRRRALLQRFLPRSACVDVELRSAAQLRPILAAAGERKIKRIISVHDFHRAPSADRLDQWARDAESLGADIFKIVTRTETAEELAELVKFFQRTRSRMKVSAMGVGKFGRASRIYFAAHGSALNYVHLGNSQSGRPAIAPADETMDGTSLANPRG